MLWKIQNGQSSFWWDNWTGHGAIATYCPKYVHSIKTKVSYFILDKEWDIQRLVEILPDWLLQHVTPIKIGSETKQDYLIWKPATDGIFTNKEAWNDIREHRQKDLLINKAWHKNIPFKVSFLTWRLIKSKLPFTNNSVCRFVDMLVDCLCCANAQPETIQHFFMESEPAQFLWKLFGQPLGIKYRVKVVKVFLTEWWLTKRNNGVHKMIIHITPIIICWVMWKTDVRVDMETKGSSIGGAWNSKLNEF
ncbi:uncharacterized protein LOC132641737 [Lycium barbarum]|uniref:uncharacterized protein LOC132641737 n=1 Tax=Lycium barbarum TaxID=112863 RepID=UPI00293F40F0|nr:uncharacterized protein LOC132641737 [Lycium barbarum]